MALLEVFGLEKKYGRRKVVDGVSFDVNPGEVVGLLGPNGAGKTTSFRMATGQIVPNGGNVVFDGQDVTTLPMYRRARLGMGYLSQEQSIFRKLSVEKNLLAILEALPRSRSLGRRLTSSERHERTEAALARFNLLHVRQNSAARCSGGEKRRLEIARCLVCEPLLILLDEPFAAVDPKTTEDIRKNIRDLANTGIGILLTDHNVREVVKTADRIYLIVEGKVVCHGTPEELIRNPIAIDAYLGSTFEDDALMARVAGFARHDAVPAAKPSPSPASRKVDAPSPALPDSPPSQAATKTVPAAEPVEPKDQPKDVTPSAPLHLAVALPPAPAPKPVATVLPPPPPPPPPPRPVAAQPLIVNDAIPPRSANPPAPPRVPLAPQPPAPPPPATRLSASAHKLLEQEMLRRMVDQLMDRAEMPNAWHELASRGDASVPVLLEALERREMEIRHLAHRLLESVTGDQLEFQANAPDEIRLRQVAHLRAKLEQRS